MPLRPLEDIIGPLIVPVRGKEYPLPAVTMADGLRIHAAGTNGGSISLGELTEIILGDAQQAMLDDGIPPSIIDRALWAGLSDFQAGREAAEQVWEHGVPKAVLEELMKVVLAEATTTPPAAAPTAKPARSRAGRPKAQGTGGGLNG